MASVGHTFGPTCLLHSISNTFTRRASEASAEPPKITAQFFYCTALPIDDPLSSIPPPSTNPAIKIKPQPFSVRDNKALEDAWLGFQKQFDFGTGTSKAKKTKSESRSKGARNPSKKQGSATISEKLGDVQSEKPAKSGEIPIDAQQGDNFKNDVTPVPQDPSEYFSGEHQEGQADITLSDDLRHIPFDETLPMTSEEIADEEHESGVSPRKSRFHRKQRREKPKSKERPKRENVKKNDETEDREFVSRRSSMKLTKSGLEPVLATSPADTTGTPFLRVPSRIRRAVSRSRSSDRQVDMTLEGEAQKDTSQIEKAQADGPSEADKSAAMNHHSSKRPRFQQLFSSNQPDNIIHKAGKGQSVSAEVHIPVGVSRLHVVQIPSLKMGPIYWNPLHDTSSVVRGTWFYKDTMWPVESDVANQIEAGYQDLKPWTPTYQDELNSCIENGPEAELKVAHRLWPEEEPKVSGSKPGTAANRHSSTLAAENEKKAQPLGPPSIYPTQAAGVLTGFETTARLFEKSSMIFANARDAQILKPSLLPSRSKGRKPLANIRKGRVIGIPVVRGFDVKAWEKLNPPTKSAAAVTAERSATIAMQKAAGNGNQFPCIACQSAEEQPKPTDLVLVIHGIGQKLSERVESFHFTHSINNFRRQVNIELIHDKVRPWVRQDLGGIMVLPINWRSNLRLDDDELPIADPNHKDADSTKNQFNLKDITADSIPAVRNLISDVMLDIPYYLSHHKPKMVEAVIREANRVYRLWCINNPGFHETGKVHLMAHSLGSVMALDILAHQPTKLPKSLDLKSDTVPADMFEFPTRNLFFCGSPAGFFLLLNQASLVPRRGWVKPDAEEDDAVAGERGTYGCLAVDNIYNVMAFNDPIAYRLNATVDAGYAASLQPAFVPGTAKTWAETFGYYSSSRGIVPAKVAPALNELPRRPTTAKLPSSVELETHDFNKEEAAEKRMYLLNDNGQIDYTMYKETGALEFQYLNMLSAHSSYWTRQDFVRFLVMEIGREPGKTNTVPTFKAVKKPFGKK